LGRPYRIPPWRDLLHSTRLDVDWKMMEFLNSYYGLGTLLYLVLGMLVIKHVEKKDDVTFALRPFIICTILWLPIFLQGIIGGIRGEK
jgi:hypothetical protein